MRWTWLACSIGVLLGACADRATSQACSEARPVCTTQEVSGECVDAIDELDPECDGTDWVCPDGYHLPGEVACEWPSYCEGAPPTCTTQELMGECVDAVDETSAECIDSQYECPPGTHPIADVHCEWPTWCEGAPPVCTDQATSGDCSDAISDAPAECVGEEYVCPPGYHLPAEIHCEWPTYCEGDAPICFEDGDCDGTTQPAMCELDVWACPRGFAPDCGYPCDDGQPAPDECWDQGPGECSDTTQPASCTEGTWQCPRGWDFGGFGDACEWP